MLDKNSKEYLELLRQHLQRAKSDLEKIKKRMDLKMLEIEQVTEMIEELMTHDT